MNSICFAIAIIYSSVVAILATLHNLRGVELKGSIVQRRRKKLPDRGCEGVAVLLPVGPHMTEKSPTLSFGQCFPKPLRTRTQRVDHGPPVAAQIVCSSRVTADQA